MIISIEEARDILRLDGDDNDEIIKPLLNAIPSYLKVSTGHDWINTDNELAKTTAKFILQLWYDPQDEDAERLKRTIDNLLVALKVLGREQT